jgi:hypothetical protein
MLTVLLDAIISVGNGAYAPPADIYKILFFSLLGIVLLSAAVFLIYKKLRYISLLLGNTLSLLKKYISKAYAGLKGLFIGPIAGFAYSKEQDIFYSTSDAWQRNFGYSRLYDEAAAHFGMIVDSEPVYFNYDGKKWLIEFWKGQYGLTTGCEVGIYNTNHPDFSIPGIISDTFYDCADDEEMLFISYTLYKNGRELFRREGIHWWLTGFKLGEFSQPSELVMNISLTLKDRAMLYAFMGGIRNTGYLDSEIEVNDNTVNFILAGPRSTQPLSRTREMEAFMQRYNKQNCDRFRELTEEYGNTASKLAVVRKKDPAIYNSILNLGGSKKIFYKNGVFGKWNRS